MKSSFTPSMNPVKSPLFPNQIRTILMVDPQFFDVKYAINPFMQDEAGQLKKVDRGVAMEQWRNLKQIFESIGLQVDVLSGQPNFPDMVFCANQCFPFINPRDGAKTVLLSQMRADQRKGEVAFFETYFREADYVVQKLSDPKLRFEANGDLIPVPGGTVLWGGMGPRTEKSVYAELSARWELPIQTLELIHSNFYHLDTCFFVVSPRICAFVPQALAPASIETIRQHFEICIEIPLSEGLSNFAGNAFCPDGKNVIMEKGATKTHEKLMAQGLNVIEVETAEYMKSGGSVFCMKLGLV